MSPEVKNGWVILEAFPVATCSFNTRRGMFGLKPLENHQKNHYKGLFNNHSYKAKTVMTVIFFDTLFG